MQSTKLSLLLFSLIAAVIAFAPAPVSLVRPAERYFRIEASTFAFSPQTIQVNPGDHVTIDLVAQDYVHGLRIDEYEVEVTADPGQTARLSFTAGRPGAFHFRCTVACGAMHPFMVGKLKVGPNWLFWRGLGLGLVAILSGLWWARK